MIRLASPLNSRYRGTWVFVLCCFFRAIRSNALFPSLRRFQLLYSVECVLNALVLAGMSLGLNAVLIVLRLLPVRSFHYEHRACQCRFMRITMRIKDHIFDIRKYENDLPLSRI